MRNKMKTSFTSEETRQTLSLQSHVVEEKREKRFVSSPFTLLYITPLNVGGIKSSGKQGGVISQLILK